MKLIILLIHITVCIGLILIVLLQRGKGADMGAAFGGSSQTVFGSSGATSFLHKLTAAAAIIFMFTSLGLALLSSRGARTSIMEGVSPGKTPVQQQSQSQAPVQQQSQPQAPAGDQTK